MFKNLAILVVGVAIGYFVAKETLDRKYADRADEEILEAEEHYLRLEEELSREVEALKSKLSVKPTVIVESLVSPDDLVAQAETESSDPTDILVGEDTGFENPLSEPDTDPQKLLESTVEVFKDYQAFSSEGRPPKKRKPEETVKEDPMPKVTVGVISQLEFEMNEPDYDQTTLVYYDTDGILTDSVTDKVLDIEKALGNLDPKWFGQGCDDENTCYLRNESMGLDFEVVREKSSYAEVVLGKGDNA